jgi:hypothetical protein
MVSIMYYGDAVYSQKRIYDASFREVLTIKLIEELRE